jgi:hypothetical protein
VSVTAFLQYWRKQMFQTNPLRPPAVKGSDAEGIAFVAKTAGAVGYVSRAATLPPEVRAVTLIDGRLPPAGPASSARRRRPPPPAPRR